MNTLFAGTRPRRAPSEAVTQREWVGGRLPAPFFITEGDPYRPEIILWLELPDDLVVGSQIIAPADPPVSFARSLFHAMERPLAGAPRRPPRIRVADASLGAEIRAAVGDTIEVVVKPTPELHRVLDHMTRSLPAFGGGEEPSYLEDGRVSVTTVGALFRAAGLLWRVAPWKDAGDDQVLRVDIPARSIRGACLSIIGVLGESLGLLIFPSFARYSAFARLAAKRRLRGPIDLGTRILSLRFERGADLPPTMRREIAVHGWPVADARAYPRVDHRDRDGLSMPLTERDVQAVTACATSLAAFWVRHGAIFSQPSFEPVCESYTDGEGLTVRLTAPYQAAPLFDLDDAAPKEPTPRAKTGRNDACPCGSGKKYKKCHLAEDGAQRGGGASRGSREPA